MLKLEAIYDVVIAKDGQEAYEMVKASMDENKFFDLIFMDIQVSKGTRPCALSETNFVRCLISTAYKALA